MNIVERNVSHLIASQFPALYRSNGAELVAFIQAYYEWLENSIQYLTLTDATGFSVGDIVTQGPAGGEVLSVSKNSILVLSTRRPIDSESIFDIQSKPSTGYSVTTDRALNTTTGIYSDITSDRSSSITTQALRGAEMFACIRFCDSLLPLNSSSGAQTFIEKADNTSYINLARLLPSIRDVDLTLERFIVSFKEMFLKNIDFDIATNKRLLVKNALDLYRAKGTERAIDLFFKLVYGTDSKVYTPGDDILRASDGQYTRPVYLEVTRAENTVQLVNKVVTGTVSGATGFVERYIRRRVNNNFVYLLYLSAVTGTFENNELLRTADSFSYQYPKVVGSLSSFSILSSSTGFSVGDIVDITADIGSGGKARVTSVENTTGVVDFELVEGGWGYTTSALSLVSEKVLTLSDVQTGNTSAAGDYFLLFETLEQRMANVEYTGTTTALTKGVSVTFANSTANTATGVILSNASANSGDGTFHVSLTSGQVSTDLLTGHDILLSVGGTDVGDIDSVSDRSVTSTVMGIPNQCILNIDSLSGNSIKVGYTIHSSTGVGTLQSVVIDGSTAIVTVNITSGRFDKNQSVTIVSNILDIVTKTTGNIASASITVGVHEANATFSEEGAVVITSNTELSGNVSAVSSGSLAAFDVGSLSDTEDVFINTDLLNANNTSSVPFMDVALNATAYGFPKSPGANSASTLYTALGFTGLSIGTIATLSGVNPGSNYNVDPYVLAKQPYISGYGRRDYIMSITTPTQNFAVGEKIIQTNADEIQVTLTVGDSSMFQVGELVYQGASIGSQTANGIVSSLGATSIVVGSVSGTFADSQNVFSYMDSSNTVAVTATSESNVSSTAYGLVKSSNSSVMTIKRIQFDNAWVSGGQIVGQSTGATANIVSVTEDANTLPIGVNATITANVVTASGSVTGLEVVDSGFGYTDGELASFESADGQRVGSIYLARAGQGIATGYWRSNDGMLSSDKYLLDSDFYQEYSYQIISRIPFDKYKESVLDVLHVAGTRLFGAVELESTVSSPPTVAETSITSS